MVGVKSVDSGVSWDFPGAGSHWSMSWLGIYPQPLVAPCRLAPEENILPLQHPFPSLPWRDSDPSAWDVKIQELARGLCGIRVMLS